MPKANTINIILHTNEDDRGNIYIAGNFNNWAVQNAEFALTRVSEGSYRFFLDLSKYPISYPIQYKFHKGDWSTTESDNNNSEIANHLIKKYRASVKVTVKRWRQNGKVLDDYFKPILQTVNEHFPIPFLNKTRRVRILLPYNYFNSEEYYPTIYMHDGQNLIFPGVGFGSWDLEANLLKLAKQKNHKIIIISIDHGDRERISEFNPFSGTRLGKAEGRNYIKWVAEYIKPYIDMNYRTLPERENTGIGGSSMGGLITIYAGLIYPNHFSKLLIFSPSLWINNKIYFDVINFFTPKQTDIYIYAGGDESKGMISSVQNLKNAINTRGFSLEKLAIKLKIDPKGRHTERKWGREFNDAIKWLFFS